MITQPVLFKIYVKRHSGVVEMVRHSKPKQFYCLLILMLSLSVFSTRLLGGETQIDDILGPGTIGCCESAEYSVRVENINSFNTVSGIEALMEVRRGGQLVHSALLAGPPQDLLVPGQEFTFMMQVPMEITALDALLELRFVLNATFDANPDPTSTTSIGIQGCGIAFDGAIEYMLDYIEENYTDFLPEDAFEEFETLEEALVYFYPQLLKPNTVIKSPHDATMVAYSVFTWFFIIDWIPPGRYEKPVTLVGLNSNTLEIDTTQVLWYPVVYPPGSTIGDAFVLDPILKRQNIIYGNAPMPVPPPFPLTSVPVSPVQADSVCAILVSGKDQKSASMQQSFLSDMDIMRQLLSSKELGPRLPASSILMLNGVGKDSLLVHLSALKDKYKKVYFFYTGHATKSGKLGLGTSPDDWMTYEELTDALYESNAEDLCIVLDCCYSGKIIQPACDDPRIKMRNVQIFTSANATKISGARWYDVSGVKGLHGQFTTQLFWQFKDDTNDGNRDGKISLCESFDVVKMENMHSIQRLQDPQKKVELNATFSRIASIFQEAAQEAYGQPSIDAANLHMHPEPIGTGVSIHSFDEEYSFSIPSFSYFGWIDFDPGSLFGKRVSYAYMDANSYEVNFVSGIQFWPVINSIPSFNPFSPVYLIQDNTQILDEPVPGTVHTEAQPGNPMDRVCALIVTGTDKHRLAQSSLNTSADMFKTNLMTEALGPKLSEQNIRVEKGITADSMRAILQSMQGNYDKVYFYYMGHGSDKGHMAFGKARSEWISHTEFLMALQDVGATDHCIVIESCYSGLIQGALLASGSFQDKNIEIYTSSNASKTSTLAFHREDDMLVSYGAFGHHFLKCFGDPSADKDGVTGITMKEAFDWVYKMNPEIPTGRLVQVQSPTYSVRRRGGADGNMPQKIYFRDADLSLDIHHRSSLPIDVTANLRLDIADPSPTSDVNVFAISPVRKWQLEGDLSIDQSLTADLVFLYDDEIDVVDAQDGVLGLVSRSDTTKEWQAYYPALYDPVESTVVAGDVTGVRQWALARVVDMSSGLQDLEHVLTDIEISPNPVMNGIATLSMQMITPATIDVSVLDLNSIEYVVTLDKDVVTGELQIPIDTTLLQPGIYFVRIKVGSKIGSVPIVVMR